MLKFSKEDLMMYDAISKLDTFPYSSGGEGDAYFVSDDLVLKRYYKKVDKEFDLIFEDYCLEMQKFANLGFAVPKIYAWTKIPNYNRKVNPENRYDYYVLEERMKGRQLFYGFLEDLYPVCKQLCEKEDFLLAINHPEDDRLLFNEILTAYVKDFQMVNDYLCSMPEAQIDKFLSDAYAMCVDGRFSMPDMFPANIIFNKKGISIIDNTLENRNTEDRTSKDFADSLMTNGLIWMFFYNNFVTNPREFIEKDYETVQFLNKKRDKVIKACKQAMVRVMQRLKKVEIDRNGIISPKLKVKTNADVASFIMVREMLSPTDAQEIYSNFDFER